MTFRIQLNIDEFKRALAEAYCPDGWKTIEECDDILAALVVPDCSREDGGDGMNAQTRANVLAQIEAFNASIESQTGIMPEFTFAHLVMGDHNLSDDNIRFCLKHADEWIVNEYPRAQVSGTLDALHRAFFRIYGFLLDMLMTVPEDVRDPEDANDDEVA